PGDFRRCMAEPRPEVVIAGHRYLFLPAKEAKKWLAATVPAAAFDRAAKEVRKLAAKAERVWIDIDADVFDPAFCPAVHQPAPFGVTPAQVLGLLDAVWSDKVAGVSVSEYDPGRDVRDASLN